MIRTLLAAALVSVALVGAYLALGGGDFEPRPTANPCTRTAAPPGTGLSDTFQRVGLTALERSACELGVPRERVLLALAGEGGLGVGTERATAAFRTGLKQAVDEEATSGRLPDAQAFLLRQAVDLLPIEALIDRLLARGG